MSVEQADGIAPALTGSASADKETVVDTVKAFEVARRAEAGLSNLGKSGISAASEERYLALAATAPQAKIVETAFSKPEARRIAEASKMSAASLLVGMGVANYRVLGPREQLRWQPTVVEDELASLVSQANSGAKVSSPHVHPHLHPHPHPHPHRRPPLNPHPHTPPPDLAGAEGPPVASVQHRRRGYPS